MNRWIRTMVMPFALLPAMASPAMAQSGTAGWPEPITTCRSITESYACDVQLDGVDLLVAAKKGATHNSHTQRLYQEWDGTDWVNSSRFLYAYDAQSNIKERNIQLWNDTAWVNETRFLYAYDAQGALSEGLRQHWEGADWVNFRRTLYTFDAQGNITEESTLHWEDTDWVNEKRYLATFDAQGNITELRYQAWEGVAWVNSWRYLFTFDSATGTATRFDLDLPQQYSLKQNYPNPFNPVTSILFEMPAAQRVRLTVYDILGREVVVLLDGLKPAGIHAVEWQAGDLPSGIYLVRIVSGNFTATKTMALVK